MKRYLLPILLACLALTAAATPYTPSEETAMDARQILHTGDGLLIVGTDAAGIAGASFLPVAGVVADVSAAGVAVVVPPEDVQPAIGGLLIAPLAGHDNLPVHEVTVVAATGPEGFAGVFAGVQQPQALEPDRLRVPDVIRRAHYDGGEQDTG